MINYLFMQIRISKLVAGTKILRIFIYLLLKKIVGTNFKIPIKKNSY